MEHINILIESSDGYGDLLLTSTLILGIKNIFPNSFIYLDIQNKKMYDFCNNLVGDYIKEISFQKIYNNIDIYYSLIINKIYALYNKNLYKDPIVLQSIANQNEDFGNNWDNDITNINSTFYIKRLENMQNFMAEKIKNIDHSIYVGDLIKKRFLINFDINNLKPRIVQNFKNQFNLNKYITINTNEPIKQSKIWPENYWNKLINYIKYKNKDIEIYHIGSNKDLKINNKYINYKYFGNLDVFSAFELVNNSILHIGIEGGFIHLDAILNHQAICINMNTGKFWHHLNKSIKYFTNEKCNCEHFPCGKYTGFCGGGYLETCMNNSRICILENYPEPIIDYIEKNFKEII